MNRWKENFSAFEVEVLITIIGAELNRLHNSNDQSILAHTAGLIHSELIIERVRRGYLQERKRPSAIVTSEEKKAVLAIFPNVSNPPDDKESMNGGNMKKSGITYSGITGKIILDDEEFDVAFDAVNCFISNDGIGGYEFHGQRGFDHGRDFVEEFGIENLVVRSEEGNQVTDPDIVDKVRNAVEQSDEIAEAVNHAFNESRNNEPEYEPDTSPEVED